MTKDEMLLEVQLEVEAHLAKIEKIYKRWNLHFDRLTLIARATENDNKIIVLTTEDRAGLEKACALAIAGPNVFKGYWRMPQKTRGKETV